MTYERFDILINTGWGASPRCLRKSWPVQAMRLDQI